MIAGAGLAGAKAAEALREEGFDGRIVLVGDEDERPYERPPLSKEYLRGEAERAKAFVHDAGFYKRNDIELRTGMRVERIETDARVATLTGRERIPYDRLLIATGAEPRRLSIPGADLPHGVHYLRDLSDADSLAARLARGGGRIAVIGAGWIGSEVAASARAKGVEVALIEAGAVPLERVLGADVGGIYADIHRDHGVVLHTGATVERIEGTDAVEGVRLGGGELIETDAVVVGIGVVPRVDLALSAGLVVNNGIVTSERLEASVPGVFAAGDVANALHPFYGRLVRVEHWANALNQPTAAARAMLGKPASYDRQPYFFSDQYDVGMEYFGFAPLWDDVVLRGDPAERRFVAFWQLGGRVVAGMNVNVWDVGDQIKALIASRRRIAPELLRDPGVPLDALSVPAGATSK